jgi:hypothetical protein
MDRGPSWLYHRVPEKISEGVSEVWRDFTYETGDPTWDGIVRSSCSIEEVENSEEIREGDGVIFQRLGLTMENFRNLLGVRE